MNKWVHPIRLLVRMIWSYNQIQPMVQVIKLPWIPILLMKAANNSNAQKIVLFLFIQKAMYGYI